VRDEVGALGVGAGRGVDGRGAEVVGQLGSRLRDGRGAGVEENGGARADGGNGECLDGGYPRLVGKREGLAKTGRRCWSSGN